MASVKDELQTDRTCVFFSLVVDTGLVAAIAILAGLIRGSFHA
jgi:hypothetical protein